MHAYQLTRSPGGKFPKVCRTFGWLALAALPLAARADEKTAALVRALGAGDEPARVEAIDQLGAMGPAAKDAVGAVSALLSDKSARVRAHAAYALGLMGPAAKAAGPALVKAMADPDRHVRREAVQAVEAIGVSAEIAAPPLGKALEDADPAVQVAALDALTDFGAGGVPTLSAALANPQTRYWAALALGQLGRAGETGAGRFAGLVDGRAPRGSPRSGAGACTSGTGCRDGHRQGDAAVV